MPGPKAYIELASKPLHPEVEALNDRRLRSVARWHAFAVREEARMWAEDANTAHQRPLEQQEALTVQGEETVNTKLSGDLRENESETKGGPIEDDKQEFSSSDKTVTIERQDHNLTNGDEGTAESDSSAINDGESPEKKQAVTERADDHHGHILTLVFNRVYAQKAEMSMLDHFAPAGPYKDGGVTAPHAPAPDVNVKKTSGGDNQLDGEEMKERSMMWE
ncbi:hypothetical protein LTS09_002775 [Friedmanniomyces endolithicus]|nr:hypothetical protein LTS09_002775 [Friedmanniomyces endolithicus]